MLEVQEVDIFYGQSQILSKVSLHVSDGELVGILGRNGIGKTTLLRCIMGMLRPRAGVITLDGRPLSGLPPYAIARAGVSYAPQDNQLFPGLTVEQNLFAALRHRRLFEERIERIFRFFPTLQERFRQRAGTLSGGQQKFLTIARALIVHPRVLLLDEPSEGIQPSIVKQLATVIKTIVRDEGCGLLLVEQNRKLAGDLAERAYIMDRQTIVAEGGMTELEQNGLIRRHMAF